MKKPLIYRQVLAIRLTDDTLEALDTVRAERPRHEAIRQAILEYVERQKERTQ